MDRLEQTKGATRARRQAAEGEPRPGLAWTTARGRFVQETNAVACSRVFDAYRRARAVAR